MILPLPLLRQALRRTDLPVLVGPFRGEVGFEVMYWLPWLRTLLSEAHVDPSRVIPITRGGAGQWYGTPRSVELYTLRSVQDVRIENRVQHAQTGKLKQETASRFDRQVLRDAARQLGIRRYLALHPSAMYRTLAPFWEGHKGLAWVLPQLAYQVPLPAPEPPAGLPPRFLAMRIYARTTLPITPLSTGWAKETLTQLAAQIPVVLLGTGLHVDDHLDYTPKTLPPNVIRLTDLTTVTPENNLAVLSRVLAAADGFVGTYGGLAQLAVAYGKPTFSVYQEWGGTMIAHKHLMEWLAMVLGRPCIVRRLADSGFVQAVSPQVVAPPLTAAPAVV